MTSRLSARRIRLYDDATTSPTNITRMKRIDYLPKDTSEPRELVAAIRRRRGGELLNLDRMLLHSAPLASGWNTFLGKVRGEFAVDPKLRELAICVVAALTGAEYEFHHHAPELLKAGASAAQLAALRGVGEPGWDGGLFDPAERAIIQLATEMTRAVAVSDACFAAAKSALPNAQQLVELIAIIAAYNMVARVLVALQIEPE